MKYTKVISRATKANIYWPQKVGELFILRYCVFDNGSIVPVYEHFKTYNEAIEAITEAHKKQGFGGSNDF